MLIGVAQQSLAAAASPPPPLRLPDRSPGETGAPKAPGPMPVALPVCVPSSGIGVVGDWKKESGWVPLPHLRSLSLGEQDCFRIKMAVFLFPDNDLG